jgi:hypothetical protein
MVVVLSLGPLLFHRKRQLNNRNYIEGAMLLSHFTEQPMSTYPEEEALIVKCSR